MYISAPTIDDLLKNVFSRLIELPFNVSSTRSEENGNSSEIIGVLLQLENPRARLSRTETRGKSFSALGEFLWYLSKSDSLDFITHYIPKYAHESEDNKTIYGAYGPRLFQWNETNQVENVLNLLKAKSTSRRAVIQIFDKDDIVDPKKKEIPCTCTLQFFVRNERLDLFVNMRSNDAYVGLSHDIFAFTMIQELIARSLGVEVGKYHHVVGSLHLYENNKEKVKQYIEEGFQSTESIMPNMPVEDPWPSIEELLNAEEKIRTNQPFDNNELNIGPYWKDLVILLQIHSLLKTKDIESIVNLQTHITNDSYNIYINKKIAEYQYEL